MARGKRRPSGKALAALVAVLLAACIAGTAPSEDAADPGFQQSQYAAELPTPIDGNDASSQIELPSDADGVEEPSRPGNGQGPSGEQGEEPAETNSASTEVPSFFNLPSTEVNGNRPSFDATLLARAEDGAFEEYYPLDSLGRAAGAVVCAGPETMPEGERGSIGHVRPTGFSLDRYDWVDGKYLYNRCHLIGWQLTGENDNMRNLVTGTRYMNVEGMLPYENGTASYIESTGNHVLYRATPVYEGEDLVARGVFLEALSVEDGGKGLSFSVFCYNVQPGVSIDYATGASEADGTIQEQDLVNESQFDYILNTNTKKIHEPECPSVDDMKEKNKRGFNGTVKEAETQGYSPCGRCNP